MVNETFFCDFRTLCMCVCIITVREKSCISTNVQQLLNNTSLLEVITWREENQVLTTILEGEQILVLLHRSCHRKDTNIDEMNWKDDHEMIKMKNALHATCTIPKLHILSKIGLRFWLTGHLIVSFAFSDFAIQLENQVFCLIKMVYRSDILYDFSISRF